jgi:hypothetical protein
LNAAGFRQRQHAVPQHEGGSQGQDGPRRVGLPDESYYFLKEFNEQKAAEAAERKALKDRPLKTASFEC